MQRTKPDIHTRSFWILLLWLALPVGWAQASGVSPTVLVLPKGPGSLSGIGENVSANLNMGLMSYPIKIKLPKGRSGFTPKVNVVYSSSAGAGMMGIGWTLQAHKSIQRLTVRGLPTYTNEDSFYADGELVKVPKTPFYRARIEGGFARYRWHQQSPQDQSGHWVAEYPDGSKAYFGANDQGKSDPDSQVQQDKKTFRWELHTHIDRNGNQIKYTYTKVDNQLYLATISWVFDKSGKPLYKAEFSYEERPDPISDGKPGFDLETRQRLKGIKITSAGQQIRAYAFTFDASSGLSRLIKVVQYGTDPKKPYPIQHTIKYSDATYSEKTARMVKMPTPVSQQFKSGNADLIDVNGDGLPDIVNTANSTHKFYLNTLALARNGNQGSHDFPADQIVDNPVSLSAKLSNPSVQLLDANGDGFTDMVDAVNMKIYLNKGNQKWEDNSEVLKSFPNGFGKDPNLRFMDYNGDKKIDVIRSTRDNTTYWINDGKGSWNQQKSDPIGASFSQDKLRLIDINGDGLQDAVQIISGKMRYKKYYGYGKWSDWITIDVPGLEQRNLGNKPQFRDINGDGLADMVAFIGSSIVYFVNKNGRQFAAGKELQKFAGIDIPDSDKSVIRIADMNGNGSRDIVWISQNGKITYLELFRERPNLLKQISNGIGQRINVDYNSSVYHYLYDKSCDPKKDKGCAGPWKNKMPMPFTVVQRITTWASRDKSPATQTTPTQAEKPQIQRIYYHHGFYDGKEKKFRGFRHVETIYEGDDSIGARQDDVYYDVGDSDTYMHGKMLARSYTDGEGKIFHKKTWTWGDCPLAAIPKGLTPPIRFICQKASEKESIEGKPSASRTTRKERVYDGFGNVTIARNLGEKGVDGDEQVTKTTFLTPKAPNDPSARWFLRLPRAMAYCGKEDGPCAEVQYFYDGEAYKGLPLGQFTKGNATRIRHRVHHDKDEWIEPKRSKYDAYGNLLGSKNATGGLRTFVWDAQYQRFPMEETIHLDGYKLVMKTQWDPKFSVVVQSTDVNGQNTFYSYDAFGRLVAQLQPGDAPNKPSMRHSYVLEAPISRIITETRSTKGGGFDRKQIQCFDGLGRKLSTLHLLQSDRYLVTSHKEYNRLGTNARTWDTYEADSTCRFQAPSKIPTTRYFYDGLGRQLKKTFADGSFTSTVYEPFRRIVFDEEDNKAGSPNHNTPTILVTDGLSRTVQEHKSTGSGDALITKFTYSNAHVGGRNKTIAVTFADGSQKRQRFDLLGNLREVIDPDRKRISYTYTAANKLASITDARGAKIIFTYDALLRKTTRVHEGKPETLVTFHYDKALDAMPDATFGKGKLVGVTFPGGRYLYAYDGRGNQILERRQLFGVRFDFSRSYNNVNKLLRYTTPAGHKTEFQRDGAGRLTAIPGLIEALTYHTEGKMASWRGANGVKTSLTYGPRLRLKSIDIDKVMSLQYERDATGNPLRWVQTHGDQSFTNEYKYDALYRLTQANLGAAQETLRFGQDKLHNLTSKISSLKAESPVHLGAFQYDKARIHAAVKAGPIALQYDAAGHITQRAKLAFSWDYMGRLTKATRAGTPAVQRWYDHTRQAIARRQGEHHIFYISPLYEIRQGMAVSYTQIKHDKLIGTWHHEGVAAFFDDMAKDGKINAGDAWLYHASRTKLLKLSRKPRPIDLDMTKDMLLAGLQRLLHGNESRRHYYHVDHQGSVRAVTNAKGDVVLRKHYYPFGNLRMQTNTQLFSYGYQGSELDTSTQTNIFRERSLDPKLGRWMSPDPMFARIKTTRDEFNSYGMVINNPIKNRDVFGTSTSDAGAGDYQGNVDPMMVGLSVSILAVASIGSLTFAAIARSRNARIGTMGTALATTSILTAGLSGAAALHASGRSKFEVITASIATGLAALGPTLALVSIRHSVANKTRTAHALGREVNLQSQLNQSRDRTNTVGLGRFQQHNANAGVNIAKRNSPDKGGLSRSVSSKNVKKRRN